MDEKKIITEDLNLPFEPSPSTPCMVLHTEENDDTYVEFLALFSGKTERNERVRITFKRCVMARMVCIADLPYGAGIVKDSAWLAELNALQLKYYPDYPDNFKKIKHYYFFGHDVTVEVLAEGFTWESLGKVKEV